MKKKEKQVVTDKLSYISHELRSPLSSLTEMMKSATNNIDDKEYIKNSLFDMISVCNQMLENINDVLSLSNEIHNKEYNLHGRKQFIFFSMIKELETVCTPLAFKKNQEFSIQTNFDDHLIFQANYQKIRTICLNIINNCIKYTNDNGKIQVDFDLERLKKNSVFRITISDNGIGMDEELLCRLFHDKYICLNKDKGTGLGMYLTKEIIDEMNGIVSVSSQKGKGSNFYIRLPIKRIIDYEPGIIKDKNVLIIDDDECLLKIYENFMNRINMNVTCCSRSELILDLILHNKYDLIIVDYHFGRFNGRELAEKITFFQKAKMVIISSCRFKQLFPLGLPDYIDAFLEKPLNLHLLEGEIYNLMLKKKKR